VFTPGSVVEQISYLSPSPLNIPVPPSVATTPTSRPSTQTSSSSKLVAQNPSKTGPTSPVQQFSPTFKQPPQAPESIPRPATSPGPQFRPAIKRPPQASENIPRPATSASSSSSFNRPTDEGELLVRLCNLHVTPADIARVVDIMSGREDSTVEEAQLLRRMYNLGVSGADISVIVEAMQRRRQARGDLGHDAPPDYDFPPK
jgi:hypothetical protein